MLESIWKTILRRRRLSLLSIPAFFLWLASLVYRLGAWLHRRRARTPVKLPVPVISVGNIAVGGTGKTPLVQSMATFLVNDGIRVGIVSAGYKRQSQTALLDEGYRIMEMSATETGDEVMLMARSVPQAWFSVNTSKTEAARALAATGKVDVIIVDDGFQHHDLARDLDIVTYDAGVKRRLLRLFPHGVLREPLGSLKRADVIVITRSNFARDIGRLLQRLERIAPDARRYHASFFAEELRNDETAKPIKYLEHKSVLLFAGIGNFRSLEKQVTALAADLDYALELSDHQEYDRATLDRIRALAEKYDPDVLVTTAKDWVKLGGFDFGWETYYLDLRIDLDPGEEKLINEIEERLGLTPQAD